LSQRTLAYSRRSYSIFDVLGLIGGIIGAFMPVISIFIAPISEFDFNSTIIEKLFLAKSIEENIFKDLKDY
jgi:hypothetical protein